MIGGLALLSPRRLSRRKLLVGPGTLIGINDAHLDAYRLKSVQDAYIAAHGLSRIISEHPSLECSGSQTNQHGMSVHANPAMFISCLPSSLDPISQIEYLYQTKHPVQAFCYA